MNQFDRLGPKGSMFPIINGKNDPTAVLGCPLDLLESLRRGDQGFFAEYVQTLATSLEDQFPVKTGRGADIDKVEVILCKEGLYAGIDPRSGKKVFRQLRLSGIGLQDCLDLETRIGSPSRHMSMDSHIAETQDSSS